MQTESGGGDQQKIVCVVGEYHRLICEFHFDDNNSSRGGISQQDGLCDHHYTSSTPHFRANILLFIQCIWQLQVVVTLRTQTVGQKYKFDTKERKGEIPAI